MCVKHVTLGSFVKSLSFFDESYFELVGVDYEYWFLLVDAVYVVFSLLIVCYVYYVLTRSWTSLRLCCVRQGGGPQARGAVERGVLVRVQDVRQRQHGRAGARAHEGLRAQGVQR